MSCVKSLSITFPAVDGFVGRAEFEVYAGTLPAPCFFAPPNNGSIQGPASGVEFAIAVEQTFGGFFTRREGDTLYIEGDQLDLCCANGVTSVLLLGQGVPPLAWAVECCEASQPTPCPPCGCEDIGCYAICDRVELPVQAEADGNYIITVHVGDALTFKQGSILLAGERPVLDLSRIGQMGRFRVTALGRCFEFQVNQVYTS